MPNKLGLYISALVIISVAFVTATIAHASNIPISELAFFIILSVIAESLLIQMPRHGAISVGFAINLAAMLVFGVPEAAWIGSLGIMLRIVKVNGKKLHIFNNPLYKTLFNGANIILSAGAAGYIYKILGGDPGIIDFNRLLLPLIISVLVYIIVNAIIFSGLMAILSGDTFINIWLKNIVGIMKNFYGIVPIGIIMAIAYMSYGKFGVILFFGPLLLARYSFKMYIDMKTMYIETVKSLCTAMEAKDPYTQGHSTRVSEYACKLAARLGLSRRRIDNIKIAGILHDIGKIGIEEKILNKTGKLDENEFNRIKEHPTIGYKIIHDIGFLSDAAKIVLSHHERFDGSGYPNGLKEAEISKEACIISICDAYDAITTDRPYRNAMSVETAISIIEKGKLTYYDPEIASEFIKMINEEGQMKSVS